MRYLARKWNIPIEQVATAGDSGNDRDMLQGRTAGIVVGNYDKELASLRASKPGRIHFAEACYAEGIIEGLQHYGMLGGDSAEHDLQHEIADELENAL